MDNVQSEPIKFIHFTADTLSYVIIDCNWRYDSLASRLLDKSSTFHVNCFKSFVTTWPVRKIQFTPLEKIPCFNRVVFQQPIVMSVVRIWSILVYRPMQPQFKSNEASSIRRFHSLKSFNIHHLSIILQLKRKIQLSSTWNNKVPNTRKMFPNFSKKIISDKFYILSLKYSLRISESKFLNKMFLNFC